MRWPPAWCLGVLAAALLVGPAQSQPADTILLNGKIITLDTTRPSAEALAVRGDRILAVGSTDEIRALAGPTTALVDLDGRTVIPGLIDSHIHAIRAGVSYATEVHWIGARSISEALDRLRAAARSAPAGSWLIVAGGWSEQQFAEKRRPTQAEIAAAAPDHHVYVQLFYSAVLLSPGGFAALNIASDADVPPDGKIERDGSGRPTGWIRGGNLSVTGVFERLPKPTFAQKVAGTRAFFRTLNSVGLTGVIDPGGYNLTLADYQPLFALWRDGALTLRVTYSAFAPRPGTELEDFRGITALLPMGFGDTWLRFNGIGENVTWGMYNNDSPSEEQKQKLHDVLAWAAARRLTATFHWTNNRSVHHLLDVLERVDRTAPIAPLRWSIAHLHDASADSLQRMHRLGVGWLVQNAFYFRGEAFVGSRGMDAARLAPPIVSALTMGLPVGGGTDAHRVMSYHPFVSLQWMLDGKTVGGMPTRAPEEIPTREEALRIYTQGSAWFAFDEDERGTLAGGKLADLAVLTKDYTSVPVEEIGSIASLLTMVGGRIVYATGPYGRFEQAGNQAPDP